MNAVNNNRKIHHPLVNTFASVGVAMVPFIKPVHMIYESFKVKDKIKGHDTVKDFVIKNFRRNLVGSSCINISTMGAAALTVLLLVLKVGLSSIAMKTGIAAVAALFIVGVALIYLTSRDCWKRKNGLS